MNKKEKLQDLCIQGLTPLSTELYHKDYCECCHKLFWNEELWEGFCSKCSKNLPDYFKEVDLGN